MARHAEARAISCCEALHRIEAAGAHTPPCCIRREKVKGEAEPPRQPDLAPLRLAAQALWLTFKPRHRVARSSLILPPVGY